MNEQLKIGLRPIAQFLTRMENAGLDPTLQGDVGYRPLSKCDVEEQPHPVVWYEQREYDALARKYTRWDVIVSRIPALRPSVKQAR